MSGLSVFRLVGNVSVNGGYGVAEVAEFGLPASMIKTGRFTNDRLPLDPQIAGNLTPSANVTYSLGNVTHRWKDLYLGGEVTGNLVPSANVTYSLGSADKRWKDLYLAGNTVYLGNTVISTSTVGNTTDLIIDGSRTIQTVGRTLADSYSASYSTNARPDLVQTSVAANAANVVVSTWTTQRSAADNGWRGVAWSPQLGLFAAVASTGTGNRVMTSPDGVTWTVRTCPDKDWVSIEWSPQLGMFAAVANADGGGAVMTSFDGINWTLRTVPNVRWTNICWSPELGRFVSISFQYSPQAMRSSDGITWENTDVTGLSEVNWVGVTWASTLGLFVSVSNTGDVATSPNGWTWTSQNVNAYAWDDITYSPELGKLVATGRGLVSNGTGARVMTSTNGTSWTLVSATSASGFQKIWRRVRWAPEIGVFVAIAQSGIDRVMTSPDGENWTVRSTPVNTTWTGLCWSADLGIFCSVAYTGTGNRVMTSASALSTRIVGATSFVGSSVTIDGNDLLTARDVRVTYPSEAPHGYTGKKPALFRATTLSGVEAVSTWRAQVSAIETNGWVSVVWAADLGTFVSVGHGPGTGNRVMTSPDGITWTARASAADNSWHSVCWAPEIPLFVAVSISGSSVNRVMTSPDGVTWTARSATDNNWHAVCWSPELSTFVAVGYSGIGNRAMYSTNGTSWTPGSTSTFDNNWWSVCWGAEAPNGSGGTGLFVAVAGSGSGNRVMYSSNGTSWACPAGTTTGFNNNWLSVCWSAELSIFVAVADSGIGNRVMYSSNGTSWTCPAGITTGLDYGWRSVCWAPELGIFVAVATDGSSCMTSPNGIQWTIRTAASSNQWYSVAWAPELGIFAAVAFTGTNRVMTSRSALQLEAAGEATFKNAVVVPKLGVGTANPQQKLHVNTTAGAGTTTSVLRLAADNWGGEIGGYLTQSVGVGLTFSSIGGGSTTEAMRIAGTNVGIGTAAPTATLQVQGTCRIDNNPAVNTASIPGGTYHFDVRSTGTNVQGWAKGANAIAAIFASNPTNAGWNSTSAGLLYLAKESTTNRSINAAGTVNVSGADYAEYMKKNGDFVVAKGDVVGVDADGFLTDMYDDAVTFVIKSTNPSLVGGDVWGIEDMEHPKPPDPSTSMTPPGDDASEEEIAAYDAAVAAHDAWTAEFEARRARVDRIAFSGQVPVNVYGATPGDYIVPVRRMDDGGISAIAVPDASITFEQYRKAVGKVVKILDEDDEGGPSGGGRAFVIVKIA